MSGTQGANGWYTSPVTVRWVVSSDATSTTGCEAALLLDKDTKGTTRTCQAAGPSGTTATTTKVLKIDQTPPTVTAVTPARAPDPTGWYRAPVAVTWSGSDATSGIDSCTTATYSGPDGPGTLPGGCTDLAGNGSAPAAFGLSYDATAPALAAVSARAGDALATVGWRAAGAATVTVTRSPGARGARASTVYSGLGRRVVDTGLRNRVRYRYTVTATDAAGNMTVASASATPNSRLLGPAPGACVRRAPVLRWRSVAKASYYNVQLFRNGKKVLSTWPVSARLSVGRSWRFGGHVHRLSAGRYRWYVWAGYGARAARHYGRLLGVRAFTVRR